MASRTAPERVFHIVDAVNWNRVKTEGLANARMLLEEALGKTSAIERARAFRPEGVSLAGGTYIRDQSPMPPQALSRCLDPSLKPADWYSLLNECVFFWIGADRVKRHLHALRRREQVVLTLDGRSLLERYSQVAYVTPFNVGNARRKAASRGTRTFVKIGEWQEHGWRSEAGPDGVVRSASHPPAELVIRSAVPSLMDHVIGARRIAPGEVARAIGWDLVQNGAPEEAAPEQEAHP